MERALDSALAIARADNSTAPRMYEALREPFAARQWNDRRRFYAAAIPAAYIGCGAESMQAFQSLEPHVPWRLDALVLRESCYARSGNLDLATRAARDLAEFRRADPPPLLP
ncbi:MAG: hypothetical protein AABO58_17170 [Acidobacteriota bacterium]